MTFKTQPLWAEGVALAAPPPPALPAQVDVAVIGGGLTGLAAARELARRGVSVALLEAQHCGWGASSRNGGMVLTGLKLDAATLTARYGLEAARRMFAASLAAITCVERIVAAEAIDCDFRRSGHLFVAVKPAHFTAMQREAELLARSFDHQVTLLPQAELSREIGAPVYAGGLVDPVSAAINPARYVAGLARAAAQAGALLCEQTPVQRVERSGGKFRLATSRGTLHAEAVFAATGGYTGPATPVLRRRVFPLGSYIIATEPLPAGLARELIPHDRMVFDSRHLLAYFRLTPDGRMLFGGRAGFFPETPRTVRQSAAILRRSMVRVFPQLRAARVEYAWGGVLDASFDLMPHAGELEGLTYALGYAGHGLALATYLGTGLAAQLAGASFDNPFAAIPFPGAPLGLYTGRPWFLPFAGLWYWLLDRVA